MRENDCRKRCDGSSGPEVHPYSAHLNCVGLKSLPLKNNSHTVDSQSLLFFVSLRASTIFIGNLVLAIWDQRGLQGMLMEMYI